MTESHAEETIRLLRPYVAERDQLAHQCLQAMLNNHHEEAGRLLADYQLAVFHANAAATICDAFDDAEAIEPD